MTAHLSEFRSLIAPILDGIDAHSTVAVSNDHGPLAIFLLDRARRKGCRHVAIDPDAALETMLMYNDLGGALWAENSVEWLNLMEVADAYILDGDHNYHTVLSELRTIRQRAAQWDRPMPLILIHDVIWPYARRDHYRNPEAIPEDKRHAHGAGLGVRMGQPLADAGGFHPGYGAFAIREGGPCNGVLTAIEDFKAETPDLWASVIPTAGGLCCLTNNATARRIWPHVAAITNDGTLAETEFARLRKLTESGPHHQRHTA
jgi:hypothetical protein